ncbi:MAG: ATP-binding cassette domain-containing protein [Planctomycetaceae bacterium]|jgi:excinuclease ABC subunit A|nr:ATP-binding cassette domain-containing protein [Planctomycetaceae bacterium]
MTDWLVVRGARHNNLKGIDVPFPLGAFTAVTGVSGSGKSSLINDILWKSLAKSLHRANAQPGKFDRLEYVREDTRAKTRIGGITIEHQSVSLNKVIRVDQQPIGQTPTSNPATYTGVFELIREIFAQLPEARARGYSARRFSFNVPGGRCEKCEGAGQTKIEMHFLPDVWVTCEACNGKRYDAQTLEVHYRGRSISDVLEMPVKEAAELFYNVPSVRRILKTLCDVGLDYITLGQSVPTLSGGESQRLKLAAELSRPDTGRTLYLLDEPTTGLHFDDLVDLLNVLHRLVDLGNTVIVIEHNLDVIKNADWIVDLGPEAGSDGGYLVFAGTPEMLVEREQLQQSRKNKSTAAKSRKSPPSSAPQLKSYTAAALIPVLLAGPVEERERYNSNAVPPKILPETAVPPVKDSKPAVPQRSEPPAAEDLLPWKALGEKWHFLDKGLTGTDAAGTNERLWDISLLRELFDIIKKTAPDARFVWGNKTLVPIFLENRFGGKIPSFCVHTKRADMLAAEIYVPKFSVTEKQIVNIGIVPDIDAEHSVYDVVRLSFTQTGDLNGKKLPKLLLKGGLKLTESK